MNHIYKTTRIYYYRYLEILYGNMLKYIFPIQTTINQIKYIK